MRTLGLLLVVSVLASLQAVGADTKSNNQPAAQQPPAAAAAQPKPAQPAPKPLPFVKQVRKTVAFIELQCQDSTDPTKVIPVRATGFFVGYPDKRLGPDKMFTYLVTNRHVAECWDDQNGNRPRHVVAMGLRVNLKNGSSTELRANGNVGWILPADDSVDLALLPVGLNQAMFDFMTIPVSDFATEDVVASQGIDEGSRLLVTGYFYQLEGERKVEPIIREGTIAMMPDEDVTTTTGKLGKVYLGEVHIFGGNSGSPVFVDVGGIHNGTLKLGYDYRMLGVVSGYYGEDQEFKLQVSTTFHGLTRGNSGIAMIVPASAVRNLLDDHRLQAMRDTAVAQVGQQASK